MVITPVLSIVDPVPAIYTPFVRSAAMDYSYGDHTSVVTCGSGTGLIVPAIYTPFVRSSAMDPSYGDHTSVINCGFGNGNIHPFWAHRQPPHLIVFKPVLAPS
jgi:hypothetical protein